MLCRAGKSTSCYNSDFKVITFYFNLRNVTINDLAVDLVINLVSSIFLFHLDQMPQKDKLHSANSFICYFFSFHPESYLWHRFL